MRLPPEPSGTRGRIEVIPLIDIIFFLLATFMMVSLSMVKNQGIPVMLPKTSTGKIQEQAPLTVTVTVAESGRLYLNKEPVDPTALLEKLQSLRQQQPEMRVVFNGDKLAYYGDVIAALDHARQAGIDKVSIQTTGAQKEAGAEAP